MFDNVNAKENEITTISMRNHRHFKISFRLLCHLTIIFNNKNKTRPFSWVGIILIIYLFSFFSNVRFQLKPIHHP